MLIAVALLIGAAVFCAFWFAGYLDHVAPQRDATIVAERPIVGSIKRPSEEDLNAQRSRCQSVRARCVPAATTIAAGGDADALLAALGVLQGVVRENEHDGAVGVVASTELCNALLAADALKALERLQEDADPAVAARAGAVFQHVIPRIWSF